MLIPKTGVRIMNLISSFKIIILVFIVITGWVVLSGRVHKIEDPHASFRNSFAGSSHSGYEYATALFKVLNSYEGFVSSVICPKRCDSDTTLLQLVERRVCVERGQKTRKNPQNRWAPCS